MADPETDLTAVHRHYRGLHPVRPEPRPGHQSHRQISRLQVRSHPMLLRAAEEQALREDPQTQGTHRAIPPTARRIWKMWEPATPTIKIPE